MIRILELIVRFKEYVVLCVLVAMCFLLMTFGNAAKLRGFRILLISTIGNVQESLSWLPNPLTILSDNAALRDENYRLSREIAQTRRAVAENERFRALLQFRDSSDYAVRPARIVGRIMDKSRYYLTLNAGALDSVFTGMPIVNDKGLVGFVFSSARHHAIVQTILDKDTRIAAKVERSRVNGIIAWEGGANLYLTNVAKTEDVKEGDIVVTSDYSSRYPADIAIGKIVEKKDEPTTLFWKLRIEPAVHFPSLEYVFVGLQPPDEERLLVEELLEKRMKKGEVNKETSNRAREAIREANRLSREATKEAAKEAERQAARDSINKLRQTAPKDSTEEQ
ncbi:MAG: rod shape-determining protein MreC [Candidatus Kapabacteria bacterium]|jgi:rod shape-determining protein MreC|nr:rod shape-determining protein MreC [Candidatus Kapabacteria bacterium]